MDVGDLTGHSFPVAGEGSEQEKLSQPPSRRDSSISLVQWRRLEVVLQN